jgi:antitoxin CcdA
MRMKRNGFSEERARYRAASGGDKKPVNLRVSEDLLKAAKAAGLNLSQTLEQALAESLKQIERDRWLAENREAIESYNRYVEKYGVFSDGLRQF